MPHRHLRLPPVLIISGRCTMARVADVLAHKGDRVHVIAPSATVLEATQLMNRLKIGALVVTTRNHALEPRCDRIVGMFTERDVLTRVVAQQRNPATTLVEDVMTPEVAYCGPDTELEDLSAVMREKRMR